MTNDKRKSLRHMVNKANNFKLASMVKRVQAEIDKRDAFELRQSIDGEFGPSWAKARAGMLKNIDSLSRLFVALNINPAFINRQLISASAAQPRRFSAKAFDKITEIALFASGESNKLQRVTQAFVVCAIAFARQERDTIENSVNKKFLSNASFERLVKDEKLADYIRDYQHKYMSGGTDTQSSQVRNVLDALGAGEIMDSNYRRGMIHINTDHPLIAAFDEHLLKAA